MAPTVDVKVLARPVNKFLATSVALVALVGFLSGCASAETASTPQSTSSQDREAAAASDHPTVCYTNLAEDPIEIKWSNDPEQLIVEGGNGYQGLFARYLDTSSGKDEWVDMPLAGDFDGKGVTDIRGHRIITDSWKVGTRNKFIGVWVRD